MTILTEAATTLRDLAEDVRQCHTFAGEWNITEPADQFAKEEHDRALRLADELDALPIETSVRLDPHHADARLKLANLVGAVKALSVAVNNAGGYRVFDPDRREPIHRAMAALTTAFDEALALPPVTDTGD